MTEQKFPDNFNCETFSMIYASLNQLLEDIKKEEDNVEGIMSNCVERCVSKNIENKVYFYFC